MKNKLRVLVLCMLVILSLTACTNGADVVQEHNFNIATTMTPLEETEGGISYRVHVIIRDRDEVVPDSEFYSALVMVKDHVIELNEKGQFLYQGADLVLGVGEPVYIKIEHPFIGKLEETLTVPAAVEQVVADVTPRNLRPIPRSVV